jgi:hypothetical protein
MRLLIVSHVVHYRTSDGYHAYSAYAKEIEIWADLFPDVESFLKKRSAA